MIRNMSRNTIRTFSAAAPQFTTPNLTFEMAKGISNTTLFYVNQGLANQSMKQINNITGDDLAPVLVRKWQKMMEAHFTTQVTVLTALGYPASEQGLQIYNGQLQQLMASASPDDQEELRLGSRDLWRTTMAWSFDMPRPDNTTNLVVGKHEELGIVEAREIMFNMSKLMSEEKFLAQIESECQSILPTEVNLKHTKIQELLIDNVYLGSDILNQFDENGEKAYVTMQSLMAEHQSDPLISQYVGQAMMNVLQRAGMNEQAIKTEAGSQ